MVSTTEFLPYLIEQLKVIHTNERIGGAPYWTHPVHCLERLLGCWGNASPEAQIAILFHDTIEDSQEGEKAILSALELVELECGSSVRQGARGIFSTFYSSTSFYASTSIFLANICIPEGELLSDTVRNLRVEIVRTKKLLQRHVDTLCG